MATRKTKERPASAAKVFAHQNRKRTIYYLHEGKTKKGKPRYFFAKSVREGALAEVPEGYEVSESINAVVSVRRKKSGGESISADLQLVQDELERHRHLRAHKARVEKKEIVIHEPTHARYQPVMKFKKTSDGYAVYRMTYRGEGGWSYPLDGGELGTLVRKYVPPIGTDAFFELF